MKRMANAGVQPSNTGLDDRLPPVLSLFCGPGGLDLGFSGAGFEIAGAVDSSPAAIGTHQRNFPATSGAVGDLSSLSGDDLCDSVLKKMESGRPLGVIGGPPCQGFSRANTSSQADDPRNGLPFKYLELVRHLDSVHPVKFVVFENVLGLKDKKHLDTYQKIVDRLQTMEFETFENELCAFNFGVPQMRRRLLVVGIRAGSVAAPLKIEQRKGPRTVRDAIGHLPSPVFFRRGLRSDEIPLHPNHWTMQPKSKRFLQTPEEWSRAARSFRLLSWDSPSPTVAYGHREIHVHPSGTRRLSIYEAMLLQGFPPSYVLGGTFSEQVEQVSNAVPPPLALSIAEAVKQSLISPKIRSNRRKTPAP
jgi:DNA (cytosine-5)-methyltransferase 1